MSTVCAVGSETFGRQVPNKLITPGWNSYVKDFYEDSRNAFLCWKNVGSPREGTITSEMRAARARFKLAPKPCKENEYNLRVEALLSKLREKKVVLLWRDV